jgi:hypothetical protein
MDSVIKKNNKEEAKEYNKNEEQQQNNQIVANGIKTGTLGFILGIVTNRIFVESTENEENNTNFLNTQSFLGLLFGFFVGAGLTINSQNKEIALNKILKQIEIEKNEETESYFQKIDNKFLNDKLNLEEEGQIDLLYDLIKYQKNKHSIISDKKNELLLEFINHFNNLYFLIIKINQYKLLQYCLFEKKNLEQESNETFINITNLINLIKINTYEIQGNNSLKKKITKLDIQNELFKFFSNFNLLTRKEEINLFANFFLIHMVFNFENTEKEFLMKDFVE